jgi:hypothetical protein
MFADQPGAERDRTPYGRVGIGGLDVDVHPRRPADLLEVHVRRSVWWFEAPQLVVGLPRKSGRPSQNSAPEVDGRLQLLRGDVDDGVNPCHPPRLGRRPRRANTTLALGVMSGDVVA